MAVQAIVLGTVENLGYMSGAMKNFFDRCHYPCLDKAQGLPYALDTIAAGLHWRAVQEALTRCGEFKEDFLPDCEELGTLMAAGLEAGVH